MKRQKLALAVLLGVSLLSSCGTSGGSNTYNLAFYQDEGNKLDVLKVTVGKTTQAEVKAFQDAITFNDRRGYDESWENFDFASIKADYTVNTVYTLHDYTISFVCDEKVVGTTTYNVLSKEIVEPVFHGDLGYTYSYESFNWRNRAEDFSVPATKVEIQYSVTFRTGEDDPSPIIRYFSISNHVVAAPEGKKGYNASWTDGKTTVSGGDDIDLSGVYEDKIFTGTFTAKTYTITYDPNGGSLESTTQTVTYDQPYTLYSPSEAGALEHVGWYTADDTRIDNSGVWQIDSDVSVKARWGFSFEGESVPSSWTAVNRANLSICGDDATLGSKSLKISIVNGSGNYKVVLLKSVLEVFFADSNVVAVNFDAKGTTATGNFRSNHNEGGTVSDWTYEVNNDAYGLKTEWKTFTFKRAYLDGYVNFIEGFYPAGSTDYVLVDNVRAVTKELDGLGFEPGAISSSSNTAFVYKDGGHANENPSPKYTFQALCSSGVITSASFSNEIKSEGLRSLKITKKNEYMALFISSQIRSVIGTTGYMTFDIYTTVPINSNPETQNMVDGNSTGGPAKPLGESGYQHPANTWVTYTLDATRVQEDGRFLQVMGSTACDFYIDNITVNA